MFSTKAQAQDFSSRLEIISQRIFDTDFNPEKALLEQFGIKKKETFMTLLRNSKINAESRLDIKKFIDEIQAKIGSLPVISLILAFEPKEQTLQTLSRWFVLNTNMQVLFEISVDKQLVAGAAILSNGKYLDYSIKPKFEKIFAEVNKSI